MAFSEFLTSRRETCRELVRLLRQDYSYASILGVDVRAKTVLADRNRTQISAGRDTECGFVVKLTDGNMIFEYSLDDIGGDISAVATKIREAFLVDAALRETAVGDIRLSDEPLVQSFAREHDLTDYSEEKLLAFVKEHSADLLGKSEHLLNAIVGVSTLEVSKLFISGNRELDQNYAWVNGVMHAVYRENDKVVQVSEGSAFETRAGGTAHSEGKTPS